MSISEEEQKKAVSVVLSKLRQKDLPGLLAAQRSGKLDEFVSPHLDAYMAKNYPNNAPGTNPPPSPIDTPPRDLKRTASMSKSKPRDMKRISSMSKPRDLKRISSISSKPSHSRPNDTGDVANAMEEGCDVWVRPDRTDNWVKAKIVSIAKYTPPVSAFRKPDLDAMKQSVFVLDLQDENDAIIGEIEVLSAPMPDSLEEYETVKLRNPEGDFLNPDQCAAQHINDLISLSYLHEPAIMHCLQQRFLLDRIYTSTGPILLAVNPFKNLNIYSEKTVAQYRDAGASAKFNSDIVKKLPPHPFQIADNAYRNMVSNALLNRSLLRSNPYGEAGLVSQNQSILVSGESGAGKTETTKFIMRYLADITKDIKDSSDSSRSIENQVLQSNPILECFGNARTLRNDNSSRFGKFIEINFSFGENNDEIFRITGATIRTYLLEKVRLVRQAQGERNYHVFYELLNGCHPELLHTLGLTELSSFNYTNQSGMYERLDGVKDHEQFQKTVGALQVLGIVEEEQRAIWKIVAAVMHVGNISFDVKAGGPGGEDDGSQISPSCQHHVTACCDLLELNEGDFVKALCVQKLVIPDKVLEKMVSTAGAEHNRDNFSKSMYGALFDWLVQRINNTIASVKVGERAKNITKNQCFIGVLDIFGFENFQMNSFEQLCINFTNETLQHHFNNFVFKHEQSLYEAEGIDWNFIKFPDNSDVLNLLEDRIVGVFAICDEQVRFPKATDITLIHKLYEKCSTHSRFFAGSKEKADNVFVVKHFAGPVKYSSISFLEKNQDVVRPELANVASQSTSPLICELSDFFRIDDALLNKSNPLAVRKQSSRNILPQKPLSSPTASAHHRVSIHNKTKTLGGEFRGQMEELMTNINTTSPHYIRCLKPNSNNVGNEFDSPLIVSQLRCGGVLEAVRVSRAGYSKRFTFDVFFRRYCFYVGEPCPPSQKYTQASSKALAGKVASKALTVDSFVPSDDSVGQTDELLLMGIQVGTTSVFFRSHTFDFMERQKLLYHRSQAVKIQAHARKYNAVTRFRLQKSAAAIVQGAVKIYLAKLEAYRLKTFASIMLLQRVARGSLARRSVGTMKTGFYRLQSVFRTGVERRRALALRKLYRAAVVIQCFARSRWAVREFKQLRLDARNVEKVKLVVEDLKIKLSESAGKWKSEKVAIIAEFKAEFQDLSASLLAVEKELAVANSRNESLAEDLKMTTEDFQELDAEFAEYRDSNPDKDYAEALEIDLNTVRDDLRQARERADLLEKDNVKIPDMKALADKLQAQVEDLENVGAEQATLLRAKDKQIGALGEKVGEEEQKLKSSQAEVEEHEQRLVKLAAEKDTEVSEKVAQLQALEKELGRSLSQLQETQELQQKSQGEVAETMQALHSAVQNNVAELERFEAEKAAKVKGLEDIINSLTGDLEESRGRTDQLMEELQTLREVSRGERDRLHEELQGVKDNLQLRERETTDLLENISSLERELTTAREESVRQELRIANLESEVNDRDSLVQALDQDLAKTGASLEEARQEAAKLGEEKRELLKEVQSRGNELRLKDEVFALREQTLESGSDDLLRKFEGKQRECDVLESEKADLVAEVQRGAEQLHAREEALHVLGASEEALKEEVQAFMLAGERSEEELTLLKKSSFEKASEMDKELKEAGSRVQTLQTELETAKDNLLNMQRNMDDRDSLVQALDQDLAKTGASLEEARQEAAKLGEEKRELLKEVQSRGNELRLKDEVFALREQTLESGSDDLLRKFEGKQRECDVLESEKADLVAEVQRGAEQLHAREEALHVLGASEEALKEEVQAFMLAGERSEEELALKRCECDALEAEKSDLLAEQQRGAEQEEALKEEVRESKAAVQSNIDALEELARYRDLAQALGEELDSARQEQKIQQEMAESLPTEEDVNQLKITLEDKTAELAEKQQVHIAVVEALEDQLMALGEELADMKDEEQARAEKPMRLTAAAAICDEDVRGLEDEDIMKIQEQYVAKRAEVETLHIGLDSLLNEYKNSQNENNELVEILKSRDDMLLESVAVLEDRESALVQIKTLEDGVDDILQELMTVKGEKDELQSSLDETLGEHAAVLRRVGELQERNDDLQRDLREKDSDMSVLRASEMKASIEKSLQADRISSLQRDLREAEVDLNSARAEAASLAARQPSDNSMFQNDVSDIKQLVKGLEESLSAAMKENALLRGHGQDQEKDFEFKESDGYGATMGYGQEGSAMDGDDGEDILKEQIERDVNKCRQLSDWLVDTARLSPSSALSYSTFLVQDGKSSVKRLKKAMKKDSNYLADMGIYDDDAAAIIEALSMETDSGMNADFGSPLFPVTLSPSAPRHYTRTSTGRLSLSPSAPVSRTPVWRPPKTYSQAPLTPREEVEERKDTTDSPSSMLKLAQLEAQAAEAARIAATASQEADRVAHLYSRKHSADSSGSGGRGRQEKRELRAEKEQVARAQEKAYVTASRARDAFFLTTSPH